MDQTQQQFADLLGVSRSYLASIETGKEPSFNFILSLIETTKVNANWLLTGKGEMYGQEEVSDLTTLEPMLEWLKQWWKDADEKQRHWLEIQMKRCFPEYESQKPFQKND